MLGSAVRFSIYNFNEFVVSTFFYRIYNWNKVVRYAPTVLPSGDHVPLASTFLKYVSYWTKIIVSWSMLWLFGYTNNYSYIFPGVTLRGYYIPITYIFYTLYYSIDLPILYCVYMQRPLSLLNKVSLRGEKKT